MKNSHNGHKPPCRAPGCSRRRVARGLCTAHYYRVMRRGTLLNANGDIAIGPQEYRIEDDPNAQEILDKINGK